MVAEGKERDLLAVLRGKNDVLTLSVMHRFTVREKRKLPKEKYVAIEINEYYCKSTGSCSTKPFKQELRPAWSSCVFLIIRLLRWGGGGGN